MSNRESEERIRELRNRLVEANARIAEALAGEATGNNHTVDLRRQHKLNKASIARATTYLRKYGTSPKEAL